MRNPLSTPSSEWARIIQLLSNGQPGLEERAARDAMATVVPGVAPGWLSEHPGARAPIAVPGKLL